VPEILAENRETLKMRSQILQN